MKTARMPVELLERLCGYTRVNVQMPVELLERAQQASGRQGIGNTELIRLALARLAELPDSYAYAARPGRRRKIVAPETGPPPRFRLLAGGRGPLIERTTHGSYSIASWNGNISTRA